MKQTYELIAPCHFGLEAVLKREILGQEIDTTDIIQVLVTDYDKNEELILTAKKYILEVYKKTYNSEPYWL